MNEDDKIPSLLSSLTSFSVYYAEKHTDKRKQFEKAIHHSCWKRFFRVLSLIFSTKIVVVQIVWRWHYYNNNIKNIDNDKMKNRATPNW